VFDSECQNCRWEEARVLFGQLQTLLEGSDVIPEGLIDNIKQRIVCRALNNDLDSLERHIANFDYAGAIEIIDTIRCAHGHNLLA
jgi:hypothetical protein